MPVAVVKFFESFSIINNKTVRQGLIAVKYSCSLGYILGLKNAGYEIDLQELKKNG